MDPRPSNLTRREFLKLFWLIFSGSWLASCFSKKKVGPSQVTKRPPPAKPTSTETLIPRDSDESDPELKHLQKIFSLPRAYIITLMSTVANVPKDNVEPLNAYILASEFIRSVMYGDLKPSEALNLFNRTNFKNMELEETASGFNQKALIQPLNLVDLQPRELKVLLGGPENDF